MPIWQKKVIAIHAGLHLRCKGHDQHRINAQVGHAEEISELKEMNMMQKER